MAKPKQDWQEYDTTTRGGKSVQVRHYEARDGRETSVQDDGYKRELLYLGKPKRKR